MENLPKKEINNPLLKMLGVNTKHRAFKSADEVDKYIKKLRKEWK